ncbi:hypothetical protein A5784_10910 [Mycobacterium sp. 852013-50091_SCH5140682]|uniref:SDR family NAD(P)-dependent oxidoreductase n=1 Tax=Mycobacterium sp. 852013-50091_SCH5140682 TaxID=1834109 RepID=UPI0007EA80D5|nr:SDR family NAD(P)-dependent oxidoreductase [Mycobacterium sp. 852013-50091_SCH5140682]OBC05570.1 hypothetical protein A5784_10910 [Mycobacterium sp. 852013-50091_SCH5140682]
MTKFDIAGTTAIVTGAGRGFGRGVATALVGAGAHVIGVARGGAQLDDVGAQLGARFTPVCADAADAATAVQLIDRYRPAVIVLAAGAAPRMGRLVEQTWESFSENSAVAAYAAAAGVDPDAFVTRRGAVLTPEQVGKAILEILAAPQHRAYLLGAEGPTQLP